MINSKQSHLHIAILRQVSDDVVGWMKEADSEPSEANAPPTPDQAKKAKQMAAWAKLADLPKRAASAAPTHATTGGAIAAPIGLRASRDRF